MIQKGYQETHALTLHGGSWQLWLAALFCFVFFFLRIPEVYSFYTSLKIHSTTTKWFTFWKDGDYWKCGHINPWQLPDGAEVTILDFTPMRHFFISKGSQLSGSSMKNQRWHLIPNVIQSNGSNGNQGELVYAGPSDPICSHTCDSLLCLVFPLRPPYQSACVCCQSPGRDGLPKHRPPTPLSGFAMNLKTQWKTYFTHSWIPQPVEVASGTRESLSFNQQVIATMRLSSTVPKSFGSYATTLSCWWASCTPAEWWTSCQQPDVSA